ncbi:MAG: DUF1476 family protein [Phycisphaera sp.]|nr:DUF1476 family protein [Phycisphaera sp.]
MSGLDERRKGMEAKLAHDDDLRFKVTVRRNKLLGLWVAEQLGKAGDDAEAYAKEVVKSDFEEVGDADVIRKVLADLSAGGLNFDEAKVRQQMDRLMIEAHDQIEGD